MQLVADQLALKTSLPIYHIGPSLDLGPLPTLFYFALSGRDSLELDPFNQPVVFLHGTLLRIFSFTLPGHGPGLKNTAAINVWSKAFLKEENPIATFVQQAKTNISLLIDANLIDEKNIAVAGLSRGGFAAVHLAAREPRIKTILGFAPLTRLDRASEFQTIAHLPAVKENNLEHLIPHLSGKSLCFHIGNLDTLVHTEECFMFIHKLAKFAYENRVRSPQVEMVVHPSIGHHGHGTARETFLEGTNWLKEKMRIL
ncbi:Uncharacterized protein PHSC3_000191 [Chlamydiales bacterium STE3]|nr:Uncharacterized protein PHSC3_000191 [Chlamydiales bacterium STE3]